MDIFLNLVLGINLKPNRTLIVRLADENWKSTGQTGHSRPNATVEGLRGDVQGINILSEKRYLPDVIFII